MSGLWTASSILPLIVSHSNPASLSFFTATGASEHYNVSRQCAGTCTGGMGVGELASLEPSLYDRYPAIAILSSGFPAINIPNVAVLLDDHLPTLKADRLHDAQEPEQWHGCVKKDKP